MSATVIDLAERRKSVGKRTRATVKALKGYRGVTDKQIADTAGWTRQKVNSYGGVPTSDGTFATFIDVDRGYVVLEGNTSDRTFLDIDGPAVWRPRDEANPVGLAEIAERLGVARATVDQWRARDLLPEPTWRVGGRPAWDWDILVRWARDTGRLPD